jgi:hypothetical protein
MTLVVARQFGDKVYLVSDMEMTICNPDPDQTLTHADKRIIKVLILKPDLCVAVAGDEVAGSDAVSELSNDICDRATIVAHFLQAHVRSSHPLAFIVAFGPPDSHVVQIKGGRPERVESGWIGQQDAFSAFQEYAFGNKPLSQFSRETEIAQGHIISQMSIQEVPQDAPDNGSEFSRLKSCMEAVISDGIPGVGGFAVPVAFDRGRFRYMSHATQVSHPIKLTKELTPLPFSTAAEGGYWMSFCGSEEPDPPYCAAVHIPQGNFGLLFAPVGGRLPRAEIIRDVLPIDFEEAVFQKYNRTLLCPITDPSHYFTRGNSYLNDNDFDGAIKWLTQAIDRGHSPTSSYATRGLAYGRKGDLLSAIRDFDKAIELDPTNFEAYCNRGFAYSLRGQLRAATSDCEKALELRPDSEVVMQALNELRSRFPTFWVSSAFSSGSE